VTLKPDTAIEKISIFVMYVSEGAVTTNYTTTWRLFIQYHNSTPLMSRVMSPQEHQRVSQPVARCPLLLRPTSLLTSVWRHWWRHCWRHWADKQRVRERRFLRRAVCRQRWARVEPVTAAVQHETVRAVLPSWRSVSTTYWRSTKKSNNKSNWQCVEQATSLRYRCPNRCLAERIQACFPVH